MGYFAIVHLLKIVFSMYFSYILSLYNHQRLIFPFIFVSSVLYHISAQYFNDQVCFPCLISLLEENTIILCELRDQGGGG